MSADSSSAILRFSTHELAPARRLPALQDLFDRSVQLRIDAAPGHAVEMELLLAPGMRRARMLSALTADVTRPAEMLSDREDTVCLMIKTGGRMRLSQGRREGSPQLGDGVLLVYRQPAMLSFEDATYLSVRVPYDAIAPLAGVDDLAGQCVPRDDGALRLLRAYVTSLPDRFDDPRLGRLAATHVHDLMALALGATKAGRELASQRSLRVARLEAMKADLVGNRDLTLDQLAARQGVTPRYVQMLFEEAGTTFSEFLSQQRLDAARQMLCSPRYAAWSVTQIALEAGFSDVSHFNRRFKRRFLMTPSDMRMRQGGPRQR